MTSVTEELRAMLDERGVEWWEGWDKDQTLFDGANGVRWTADYTLGELFLRSVLPITPEQAIEATLGAGTCREVYLLMATDIGDGREEVLGVYATEEAAMAAINESQFGYALHHVRKWEVGE